MFCRYAVLFRGLSVALLVLTTASVAPAGDWPMWRYDAGHSAAAPHDLPETLTLTWIRQYTRRVPVWDDPLNRDMMPYDRIFESVVSSGRMFVGFNDSDKVVAFDVRDGSEIWTFYTDGPVRFSPVVDGDSLYVASDDGCLYCLSVVDGRERWRFRGGPSDRKVIGNRRMISSWPARGGPVLADDTVYFAASIWPFMGTFVYALDARSGEVRWLNDDTSAEFQKQPHSAPSFAGVAPQGQFAVAGDLLLVPGGRSLPAAFDRNTGELAFFDFGGKGEGGSFVAADESRAFVHTRVRGTMALSLPDGAKTKLRVNEPVLAGDVLYTATKRGTETDEANAAGSEDAATPIIEAYNKTHEKLWEIAADGTGDLIKAGDRLYAAGQTAISAIDLPKDGESAKVAWSIPVEGEVLRLLAAADRLFAVTLDGRILAFADGDEGDPVVLDKKPLPPEPAGAAADKANALLELTGQREGYALWFGVDDPDLLEATARQSDLHIVAVDEDADRVAELRERWDEAGLYGHRISLHEGDVGRFAAPPYVANLVYVSQSAASALSDVEQLKKVYESVRPYGGKLWIEGEGRYAFEELAKARTQAVPSAIVISREGALLGAGDWTHAYGDVANSVKSDDRRVKLPLGILWFGGPSNMDVLPRHGHGPSEQVIGGRLFIEGMNNLQARDVYTGRILWTREFADLGTYQIYFDETYENTPLSTAYNQVHTPGANARGTNYVATDDGVYLVIRDRCLLLDAATGKTLREFVLPTREDGTSPEWGYIGVYEDLLLAGVGFGNYTERLGYKYEPSRKKGVAWTPDFSGSLGLMAFDRRTGEVRWKIDARHSFLHNGIVAGGGRVYLLDKLPKRVEEQKRRRGADPVTTYRLLTVDAETGEPLWTVDNAFGSWLSYSEEYDLLLQAGAAASDRSLDEVSQGMAVYRAVDGGLRWEEPDFSYAGPCILHGDTIITNTTSYKESQGAFGLLDGTPAKIADPVTGEPIAWRFVRTYGCNTAVASENLLTFRSGAAGFYDLVSHSGTGNFGGFKSGCTSNLIIANGVLNAPDYTRTCTCGYQNQTSLAMVPMPENEMWTYNLFAQPEEGLPDIRRVGVNFGAPGDRRADDGTLWVNYPADEGTSPKVLVEVEGVPKWFRNHAARIAGGPYPWVAASGAEGIQKFRIRFKPPEIDDSLITISVAGSADDAEEAASGEVGLTSSDLELTTDDGEQVIGIRFQDLPLEPGTRLERAYVQFEVDEPTSESTKLEIRGQAIDNAPAFTTAKHDISSRETTKAVVSWEPKPWSANAAPGPDHQTPDLTAVLNEILERPGWKKGNALALIVRGWGKRVATAADGGTNGFPKLVLKLAETNGEGDTQPENLPPLPKAVRDASANSLPPLPKSVREDEEAELPPLPKITPRYTVRMVFSEPVDTAKAGDRVFDVLVQGEAVASGFDVAEEAGGPMRSVIATWSGIPAEDVLEVELRPTKGNAAVVSGIEVVREN